MFLSVHCSYFVSAFFTRTSLAILTCLIVYCISYLPFVVLSTLEVNMLFWQKTLAVRKPPFIISLYSTSLTQGLQAMKSVLLIRC